MAALIAKVDCFIFDCDGVIWRGDSVIEGVPETLDYLRSLVRRVFAEGWVVGAWRCLWNSAACTFKIN